MSYKKGDVLPLDASPECLKKTEVLREIWTILSELGNHVTTFVIEPERNAGPMMLAIKCLKEGILKDEDLGKEEKATLATALRRAADWQGVHHVQALQNALDVAGLERKNFSVDPVVKHKEIKIALQKLEKATSDLNLQHRPSRPQALTPRAGHRQDVGSSRTVIMANLAISDDDRSKYLDSWNRSVGVVPMTGPCQSPVVLWGENLLSLAGSNWLDDNVVDAYLRLLCHHGNGHFELAQDVIFQEGSPKWFAWPAVTFSDILPTAMWPPNMYDEARPQDVKHHFLPCIEGYNDEASEKAQSQVVDTLKHFSGGILDLSAVHVQTPDPQPIQVNSYECGVLAINVARWLLEGWDFPTLRARDCPQYRKRMVVELEKWNLI
ncbi:MAG: hypothetical protein LQ337_003657 [Flavoplaca oasis]|nr:MAG: hypothetical protein LQ337_003657 [Flavoplaca oasis]